MREIVTVQIGALGNSIGDAFWNMIATEHGINHTGIFAGTTSTRFKGLNTLFDYDPNLNSASARAVAVDTDELSINKLQASLNGLLLNPENMIRGNDGGAGNCFGKGYLNEGRKLIDDVMKSIRSEVEKTNSLQGFQMVHALGGGTGSGLGCLVLEKLADQYPKKLVQTFSVIPSTKVSTSLVEPYNFVLSFPHLLKKSNLTYCLDNDAVYDICVKELGLSGASKQNLSHLIANTMSNVTTSLRFSGQLNSSMKKLCANLCPFPNLHFLVTGFSPLNSSERVPYKTLCVPELVLQIFQSKNVLAAIDLREGKMLSVAAIFRGIMSPKHVDGLLTNAINKNKEYFPNWIPNNIKTSICEIPPNGLNLSSAFIANSTAITKVFNRTQKAFRGLLQRKAFLHSYLEAGMEEMEFVEAENSLNKIIKEYMEHGNYKEQMIIS